MNVNKVTFENDCHVAKIGRRTYYRVPEINEDIPYIPNPNPMWKTRDENTYELFKSIECYLLVLTSNYSQMLEIRECMLNYITPESDTAHDREHPWQIPYTEFSQLCAKIEEHRRNLHNFQNNFNAFYSQFFDLTAASDTVSPSEEMWKTLAKAHGWRPE